MCAPVQKIKFTFNKQKAIETILFFANAREDRLSVMHMLKFIYYADVFHLNKYDRPIIGDSYYAMKNGPVASHTYDILKATCVDYKIKPEGYIKKIIPLRQPDLDYFSDTDIEIMEFVLEKFKDFDAEQMSIETHKTKAWKNAWDKKSFIAKQSEMNYEDFLDSVDPNKIKYLKECGELMVF